MADKSEEMDVCPSCGRAWSYEMAVYAGDLVRRYCKPCRRLQVGEVTRWRPERANGSWHEFSMFPWGEMRPRYRGGA